MIEVPALERASRRPRAAAAVGVEGSTKEPDGRELAAHLQGLHARLKAPRYRHQPLRRVPIPTGQGKPRPSGIAACEAKVVQDAVRAVREVIDAQDCLECSEGCRPGRRAHDAGRTLDQSVHRGEGAWRREADIVSCFDRVDRTELKRRRALRGVDGARLRRIGPCVPVGGRDGEASVEPALGPAQGAVLAPRLGHGSRHDGLDLGFETEVKPRLGGKAPLIRYGDDCIRGCEREDEARRVVAGRDKRLGRCGLPLHPDQPRLWPCGRPPQGQQSGKGPATFDFLGCTC